ncbi:hypothetical protein DF41_15920 [Raoultella planticola]|nr:hypothetical protein DF41_15920 [Raoultella planticola]
MDEAQQDMHLRVDAVYCTREVLLAVHAGNQDILKSPVFQLARPELCTFFFCQPHTQKLFLTFDINAQCEEHCFVNHAATGTHFHYNAVKINNGIQRIQRSVLPLSDLFFDCTVSCCSKCYLKNNRS